MTKCPQCGKEMRERDFDSVTDKSNIPEDKIPEIYYECENCGSKLEPLGLRGYCFAILNDSWFVFNGSYWEFFKKLKDIKEKVAFT